MSHRILIVDDDELNLDLVARILKMDGHDALRALCGSDAIKQVETSLPDLVILDMMMPCMDGFELCRRLRQQPQEKRVPIIMLTASVSPQERKRAIEAGADVVLGKPFELEVLQKYIRALVPDDQ